MFIRFLFPALLFLSACASVEHVDRRWWLKRPADDERAYFDWALAGPLSPTDGYVKPKDFVGWYGILKSCRMAKIMIPQAGRQHEPLEQAVMVLDHRYADQVNVYRGIGDHTSIPTVSLFGEGEFVAIADSCGNTNETGLWKGDLVRAYGDVRRKDDQGRWIVEAVKIRAWPRDQYELAPLRAKIEDHRVLRTAAHSWPKLTLDRDVESNATLIDAEIRSWLIGRLANETTRSRAARALAEYGGSDAIKALAQYRLAEPLKRAKRLVGPSWRPQASDPFWKEPDAGGLETRAY